VWGLWIRDEGSGLGVVDCGFRFRVLVAGGRMFSVQE
jgi:hypothetical protein